MSARVLLAVLCGSIWLSACAQAPAGKVRIGEPTTTPAECARTRDC